MLLQSCSSSSSSSSSSSRSLQGPGCCWRQASRQGGHWPQAAAAAAAATQPAQHGHRSYELSTIAILKSRFLLCRSADFKSKIMTKNLRQAAKPMWELLANVTTLHLDPTAHFTDRRLVGNPTPKCGMTTE